MTCLASADIQPSALVIAGEPGIGKTTSWLAGVARAQELGFRILSTRADEAESVLAYAAVADLLEDVEPEVLDGLPERQRVALDRVLRALPGQRHRCRDEGLDGAIRRGTGGADRRPASVRREMGSDADSVYVSGHLSMVYTWLGRYSVAADVAQDILRRGETVGGYPVVISRQRLRPDPVRARCGEVGGRRHDEQGHRFGAVHQSQDRRAQPQQRQPETRRTHACRTGRPD